MCGLQARGRGRRPYVELNPDVAYLQGTNFSTLIRDDR